MEILILLFVLAAIAWYLMAEPEDSKFERKASDDPRYRAVKIKPCKSPCQAVLQTSQIIFLASQAPKLPLNACDRITVCDCQFRHYLDRRQQEERRNNSYIISDVSEYGDRRSVKHIGRRASDQYSVSVAIKSGG